MNLNAVLRAVRPRALGRLAALASLFVVPMASHAANYVPDPTWNSGLMYADNFAASGADYRRGQKIVKLDNGDVIVAGVVPGVGIASGHTKIGLVRYNHAGVRQIWSNAGVNGFFGNQYVITPCTVEARCGDVLNVIDIKRYGERVFVLADTEDYALKNAGGNPPLLVWVKVPRVDVYAFGTDGSLQGITTADADDYADDNSRTVFGSGIAIYDNQSFPTVTTLLYAGTGIVNGVYRPRFARFGVSNGSLTSQLAAMEPSFGSFCAPGQYCQFGGIALGGRPSSTSAPRIYVTGSQFHGGPGPGQIGWPAGWDTFAASLNSNGTPRASFSSNGIGGGSLVPGVVTTEGLASSSQSAGIKIAVDGAFSVLGDDEVFVASDVELNCRHGIAVTKLGQDGAPAATFGSNGTITYGGSNESNDIACANGWRMQSIRIDFPTGIVYSNDKIAVSGLNVYGPGVFCINGQPCPEDNVDGEVAVIDSNTGTIESWRGYAYSDTVGGARSRHSGFWGIVANGDDSFSMAGDVRYFDKDSVPANQRGKQMFATLRIAPFGDDVIFKNGFD